MSKHPSYLIVNADDYGYYRCVSRGILAAHRHGIVTATGVLANGAGFERDIDLLGSEGQLDVGVHLNVTSGPALSAAMRSRLDASNGHFSGKAAFAGAYLAGRIPAAEVEEEWRAQIERCRNRGLRPVFLNSHEHMHMFPSLFDLAHRLAADYGIAYVRCPRAEGVYSLNPGVLLRDVVLTALATRNLRRATAATPHFLGLRASGRLTESMIDHSLRSVVPGRAYELMCHPGYLDPSEVGASDLLKYHDWEGELQALCSPALRALLERRNIRLIGFRDLAGLPGSVLA
jgi:chitin disaccharide deacetylase